MDVLQGCLVRGCGGVRWLWMVRGGRGMGRSVGRLVRVMRVAVRGGMEGWGQRMVRFRREKMLRGARGAQSQLLSMVWVCDVCSGAERAGGVRNGCADACGCFFPDLGSDGAWV